MANLKGWKLYRRQGVPHMNNESDNGVWRTSIGFSHCFGANFGGAEVRP